MFRRFVTTAVAAAALLAAAPTLAEQKDREAEPKKLPPCCERLGAQMAEQHERMAAAEKKAPSDRTTDEKATRKVEDHLLP